MHIEGRKGEVTLPDGRVVSRQRAHQINNPDKYREQQRRYAQTEQGKATKAASQKRYHEKRKNA